MAAKKKRPTAGTAQTLKARQGKVKLAIRNIGVKPKPKPKKTSKQSKNKTMAAGYRASSQLTPAQVAKIRRDLKAGKKVKVSDYAKKKKAKK
jgi:hypothetical protein